MIGIGSSNDAPLLQRGKVIAIEMDAAANADGLAKRRRPHWTVLRQQFQDPLGDSKSSDALSLRCSNAEVGQDRASGVD